MARTGMTGHGSARRGAGLEWDAAEGISRSLPVVSWDILICSIAERTELLKELLAELKRQRKPGVGVRVFRDNKDRSDYGGKCKTLLESSKADYVCFLDDDDWVAEDYVDAIRDALMHKPDYVGFQVHYTNDGVYQVPVYHSTTFGTGWRNEANALYRDINHFNPIKREIALKGLWEGGDGADSRWADQIREQGLIKEEIFIDRELHHYRFSPSETFTVSSARPPLDVVPHLPKYRWVRWL